MQVAKLSTSSGVWKPMRSQASSERRSSPEEGSVKRMSALGRDGG